MQISLRLGNKVVVDKIDLLIEILKTHALQISNNVIYLKHHCSKYLKRNRDFAIK